MICPIGYNIKEIHLSKFPCWFFHKWKIDREIGVLIYQTCVDCNSRRVLIKNGLGAEDDIDEKTLEAINAVV